MLEWCGVYSRRVKAVFNWLFRDRRTGAITIAQFPNVPLWIFIGVVGVRWVLDPDGILRTVVDAVGTIALGWWAGDEVLRGVNPFRRLLGATVLGFVVFSVFASRT